MNIEIKDEMIKESILQFWCLECLGDLYLPNTKINLLNSEIKHIVTKEYVANLIANCPNFQIFLNEKILRIFYDEAAFLDNDDIIKYARIAIKNDSAYSEINSKLNKLAKKKEENFQKKELEKNKSKILKQAKKLGYKLVKK